MRFNRSPSCGQDPQSLAVFFFAPKLTLTGKSLARFPFESGVQAGKCVMVPMVHRCTSLPLAVKHTVRQFKSRLLPALVLAPPTSHYHIEFAASRQRASNCGRFLSPFAASRQRASNCGRFLSPRSSRRKESRLRGIRGGNCVGGFGGAADATKTSDYLCDRAHRGPAKPSAME